MSASEHKLSDDVVNQIELMYSGRGTKVCVSTCLAKLFIEKPLIPDNGDSKISTSINTNTGPCNSTTTTPSINNSVKDDRKNSLICRQFVAKGIPVLVFDTGDSACRICKKLTLYLTDAQTGFLSFSQTLNEFNRYKRLTDVFHTFSLNDASSELKNKAATVASLRFSDAESAEEFCRMVRTFEQDMKDDRDTDKKRRRKKNRKKAEKDKESKGKLFGKTDISGPIWFKHVTSIKVTDLTT